MQDRAVHRAHRLITISAVLAGASQAAGMIVWLATRDVGLYEFDLSALQSAEHNPFGYLIPWIGTTTSMVLLFIVGLRLRSVAPVGGTLLVASMGLFIVNGVISLAVPERWTVHAALARVSFLLLIGAHVTIMRSARLHVGVIVAVLCLSAAIVLYVLPFWFGIDLPHRVTGVDMRTFIGIAESVYLVVFYGTMLHAAHSLPLRNGMTSQA